VVQPCCCGLDAHKRAVQAGLLRAMAGGTVHQEQRTVAPMTDELLALLDWLRGAGGTPVARESTGVSWQPLYNLLDGHVTVLVINAQHSTPGPGRKTDGQDAAWSVGLLRHGLVRPRFVPDRKQRDLREVTRYRKSLVDERSAAVNRLQKMREGANIKLAGVAKDSVGQSGREMLERLVAGQTDPAVLAPCARQDAAYEPRVGAGACGPLRSASAFPGGAPPRAQRRPGCTACGGERGDCTAPGPF
jgi:transposase